MYTIAQIEQVAAAIHNQADESAPAQARSQAIAHIYLNALSAGLDQVEKETLSSEEVALIDHFLSDSKGVE